jgi:signal transduction histidine kinase
MVHFVKKHCLLFLFLMGCIPASLFAFQATPSDTLVIQQLLQDALKVRRKSKDSAFVLIEKARVLAEELDLPGPLGDVYMIRASTTKFNGAFLKTLPDYKEAIAQYRLAGDSLSMASALALAGANYMVMDEYTKSLEHYFQAAGIHQRYASPAIRSNLGSNYRNIGNVFRSLGDYEQAEKYLNMSREIFIENRDTNKLIDLNERFALLEYDRGNFDKALPLLEEVVRSREKRLGSAGHAYRHIAKTLDALGRSDEALAFFQKAVAFAEVRGKVRPLAPIPIFLELARYYQKKAQYGPAFDYLEKSIEIIEANPGISYFSQAPVMEKLAELSEEVKDYESAYFYYKKYTEVNDSLAEEKNNRQLAELRALFETEQKQQEIEQLKAQEALRTHERNNLIFGLSLLVLLGIYILFLLRKNNRQLKTEVQQKERIEKLLKEKHQLYEDLKSTQEQLIHNEKMISLGQLTAGIAHEINNPINYVSTSTQALQMDFRDLEPLMDKVIELRENGGKPETAKEIRELAEKIDLPYLKEEILSLLNSVAKGVSRTEKIISGLRSYSRKKDDGFHPANINDCLRDTLVMLNSRITSNIHLHQQLGNIPPVHSQVDKLSQVFVNLITNAIDALQGEGELFVVTKKEGNHVVVEIRDTGKGMDEATQQRIFEPFFTTKPVGKGTGLGLFISYGIIKQHKGELLVSSKEGKGTTFKVLLPLISA